MEKLIIEFPLPSIGNLDLIETIVSTGFNLTNCKFWISFGGSKGYLDSITINCEGVQKDRNNVIWLKQLVPWSIELHQNKIVKLYHSNENGVRLEMVEKETLKSEGQESLAILLDDQPQNAA